MNFIFCLVIVVAMISPNISSCAEVGGRSPVNPNATEEARLLLNRIYSVTGKNVLTGQHNYPSAIDGFTRRITEEQGDSPAVFGQDFGFSPRGTLDDITRRQEIVNECIKQHRSGSIITLMWHAVRPTEDEPVTFKESIQGELSKKEWQELIMPGTETNERWKSQVDVIAWYLKQLREEKIPVLWRPYHEMNGGWFWWGHKKGPDGYKKLWRMLYERLVNFHQLDNLIWVWNANEMGMGKDPYPVYFPGHDVVDILATDVYRENYAKRDYEELLKLANGKPIAIGECGPLPTPELLEKQPQWAWFMSWSEFPWESNERKDRDLIYQAKRTWTRGELPWATPKQ